MLDQNKNKGEPLPYLANVNVRWGEFSLDGLRTMRFESKEMDRYGLKFGDIVMCEGGEPGRCAIWKNQVPGMMIQKALHRIRPSEVLDYRFLHYSFLHIGQSNGFDQFFTGSTIKHLPSEKLAKVEVPIPPLPVQRRIAGILSAYDELMENSQRRIRLLEAMARALYREWFVHFRFPGHEKHPRVASPLGDIPQGWEVKLVKDILSRRAAGTVYRDEDVKPEGAIPVLDQSTNELLGFHDNEPDHRASPTMPMAIFGDHTCKMQLLIEPFSVGPNVVPFAAGRELPTAYVFFAVNSLVQTQEYKRHWIPLNAKEVIVADRVLAQRFASLIQPMLVEQATLRKAIRNLRRTRDLLLPRLLSGQVNLTTN